jgi:hypothetical protein
MLKPRDRLKLYIDNLFSYNIALSINTLIIPILIARFSKTLK